MTEALEEIVGETEEAGAEGAIVDALEVVEESNEAMTLLLPDAIVESNEQEEEEQAAEETAELLEEIMEEGE